MHRMLVLLPLGLLVLLGFAGAIAALLRPALPTTLVFFPFGLLVLLALMWGLAPLLIRLARHLSGDSGAKTLRPRLPHAGKGLLLLGLGSAGGREILRIVKALDAANALDQIFACVVVNFHDQECSETVEALSMYLPEERVIAPEIQIPGWTEGFDNQLDIKDDETRDAVQRELDSITQRVRGLNYVAGSVTIAYWTLSAWGGHTWITEYLVKSLKGVYNKGATKHVGHLHMPRGDEHRLIRNMRRRRDYPKHLGLHLLLVTEEGKRRGLSRQDIDQVVAAGIAACVANNRVDPSQRHGINLISALEEAARGSGGLTGVGIGRGTSVFNTVPKHGPVTAFVLRMVGRSPHKKLNPQRLADDVEDTIRKSLLSCVSPFNPPHSAAECYVNVVIPVSSDDALLRDRTTRRGRQESLPHRVERLLRNAKILPDQWALTWTAACIESDDHDRNQSEQIMALFLFPLVRRTDVWGNSAGKTTAKPKRPKPHAFGPKVMSQREPSEQPQEPAARVKLVP